MHSDADQFASLIAGLEAVGLSRSEIATSCHVTRATIWRLAAGEAREPTFATVRRIERLYEKAVGPSPLRR